MKNIIILLVLTSVICISCTTVNFSKHPQWLCSKKYACLKHPRLEEPNELMFDGYYDNTDNKIYEDFPYEDTTFAGNIGYKTGNALNMNLFTSFSGSGVNNPYEYAFTVGSTGVLSSGKVSGTHDEKGNKIKEDVRVKNQYNSHDSRNRNQLVGGASIKLGNFMISSYNDIFKLPLFWGMNSDQY